MKRAFGICSKNYKKYNTQEFLDYCIEIKNCSEDYKSAFIFSVEAVSKFRAEGFDIFDFSSKVSDLKKSLKMIVEIVDLKAVVNAAKNRILNSGLEQRLDNLLDTSLLVGLLQVFDDIFK